jgi:hypothetical protein
MIAAASRRVRNHSMLKHSSRSRPLKLSSVPFCQGFPGAMCAVSMPSAVVQRRIALETNSGPLSDLM